MSRNDLVSDQREKENTTIPSSFPCALQGHMTSSVCAYVEALIGSPTLYHNYSVLIVISNTLLFKQKWNFFGLFI